MDGWGEDMGLEGRVGTLEGVAGSEKVLPENFVPPPYLLTPGHFTSSWQGPSLSPSALMALPHPGKGCKVLGVLGNYQRQRGGEGGQEGSQHFLQL